MRPNLAREAAANHLGHLLQVYQSPPTDEQRIAPEERRDHYQTLWECYAPDLAQPATRWDAQYYARRDFVGWTGLGPIALLVEQVLGLDVRAAEDRIVWTITRADRHGALRVPFGLDGQVDLLVASRASDTDPLALTIDTERPLALELRRPGRAPAILQIPAGGGQFDVP